MSKPYGWARTPFCLSTNEFIRADRIAKVEGSCGGLPDRSHMTHDLLDIAGRSRCPHVRSMEEQQSDASLLAAP